MDLQHPTDAAWALVADAHDCTLYVVVQDFGDYSNYYRRLVRVWPTYADARIHSDRANAWLQANPRKAARRNPFDPKAQERGEYLVEVVPTGWRMNLEGIQ